MSRRTAKVLQVGPVSIPNSGADALEILTDYPWPCDKAFYLRPDSTPPEVGSPIEWGDDHAWYRVAGVAVTAHKLAYDFDPDARLH